MSQCILCVQVNKEKWMYKKYSPVDSCFWGKGKLGNYNLKWAAKWKVYFNALKKTKTKKKQRNRS